MNQDVVTRYGLEAAVRGLPNDSAQLFRGFVPWAEDLPDFICVSHVARARKASRRAEGEPLADPILEDPGSFQALATRTIWNDREERGRWLLVTVDECASAAQAIAALAEHLEWNQLTGFEEGPSGLGFLAFSFPKGPPPATFFVRGNLCISVSSFGGRHIDSAELGRAIDRRLTSRPKASRASIELSAVTASQRLARYATTRTLGKGSFFAIDVEGTTAALIEGEHIAVTPRMAATVTIYAFEPGREPHSGSLRL